MKEGCVLKKYQMFSQFPPNHDFKPLHGQIYDKLGPTSLFPRKLGT